MAVVSVVRIEAKDIIKTPHQHKWFVYTQSTNQMAIGFSFVGLWFPSSFLCFGETVDGAN